VLGFTGPKIAGLFLGEALLVGTFAGFVGAGVVLGLVNFYAGGIQLTGFPRMTVPWSVFWWGPTLGAATALVGAAAPAIGAYRIRVTDVFSRVA
jgi:ABC-type antimicrobial peptide transport system permease subunit